ncbi:MAG: hypothetical protein GDA39_04200 [Hyphomonadaceae bacterium]|nr:hypothetical protein [Hyphomonadaceae bacterium]
MNLWFIFVLRGKKRVKGAIDPAACPVACSIRFLPVPMQRCRVDTKEAF